eukprot:TRINITY_DN8782_c0_g1_i1.p1 TRINITY_DN8782_c0_g1~~TRINITY_DN8782_c0_g1_i1.p1  ORF type:complete len:233 (-),score=35.71 TRINITY_DN8782_c0_g1_i1:89-787(-)
MVIGMYHQLGFPTLVEGPADGMTDGVKKMIASAEHYEDYALPEDQSQLIPDKSGPPAQPTHPDNCVADFMQTSRSSKNNHYGWTYFSDIPRGFVNYVEYLGIRAEISAVNKRFSDSLWREFQLEIRQGRPSVFLVDSDANGATDHFVVAIGYDSERQEYACYNTWDTKVHWYPFASVAEGRHSGVYGATFFRLKDPGPGCEGRSEDECDKGCEWCSFGGGICKPRGLCPVNH